MLRFETYSQLAELCTKILGITGRIGLRSRQPRLSEKEGLAVAENTGINFIQVSSQYNVKHPRQMRTRRDGVDLIFSKDGYMKIPVRYRMYLLQYDSSGHPIGCTSSSLLDLLMNFPKEELLIHDTNNVTEDSELDDENLSPNSNKEDEEDDDLVSVSSTEDAANAVDSLASYIEVGTCFRTEEHETVWQIVGIGRSSVKAEVVNPGRDLTIKRGSLHIFKKGDPTMRTGLMSYNN